MQESRSCRRSGRAGAGFALLLASSLGLGGCEAYIEEGYYPDELCGIFFACENYRDRDQGRRDSDEENQGQAAQNPAPSGGTVTSAGSSSPSAPTSTN